MPRTRHIKSCVGILAGRGVVGPCGQICWRVPLSVCSCTDARKIYHWSVYIVHCTLYIVQCTINKCYWWFFRLFLSINRWREMCQTTHLSNIVFVYLCVCVFAIESSHPPHVRQLSGSWVANCSRSDVVGRDPILIWHAGHPLEGQPLWQQIFWLWTNI